MDNRLTEYLINLIKESLLQKVHPPIKFTEITDADIPYEVVMQNHLFYHQKSGLYWGINVPIDPPYELIRVHTISIIEALDEEMMDLLDEHCITMKMTKEVKSYLKILTL